MVQPVALPDLGYRKLGPRPAEAQDRAHRLADVARAARYHFDVQNQGAERFIRRIARRSGVPAEPLLRSVDSFDQATWGARGKTLAALQAHSRTSFYQKHVAQPRSPVTGCLDLVSKLLDATLGTHVRVVRFQQGIAFAGDADLENVLRSAIDQFFQWQPGGAVRVYSISETFETFHGYLRAGYAMEHVVVAQLAALRASGFKSLRQWHSLSSLDTGRVVLAQLDHLFYPFVTGFFAGPLGLLVHFLLADPATHDPGPWPPDWPAIPRSLASFGAESVDHLAVLLGDPAAGHAATHHRFRFAQPPPLGDRIALEEWCVDSANGFEYELLDPTAHVDPQDGCIDFRNAFEHALTVDRIRRSTLACNTFPYPSATKGHVFAIADLYETMCKLHAPRRPAGLPGLPANWGQAFFKQLFHPGFAIALTDHCMQGMPAGICALLSGARDSVYDRLKASVLGGVFMPGARQAGGGVSVAGRGGAAPAVETDDVFVGGVMRALRNTHHGYLTSNDPVEAPSRYLAILDGNVADDVSLLPAIWWLACLGDPVAFCGIPAQPLGQHVA